MNVPFYRHELDSSSAASIGAVLDSPFLTSGSVGRAVEEQLQEFFDIRHAFLVNSWTNGAIAVLLAWGVGPADDVLVPAQTFIASANVVALTGANPVFVDVDPETLLVTPEHVVDALTSRTRAVIPVHLYGQMCDVAAIRKALDANGRSDVKILEDAAHCFEGAFDDRPPGSDGDCAVFSFYATKNVTCGEGGAVITGDADLAAAVRETRLHGMSAIAADRFRGGRYNHWDMKRLGVKANLPDLLAALLPKQIETIRDRLATRDALWAKYDALLDDVPVRRPTIDGRVRHARHLYPVHVPPVQRDAIIAELNAAGVAVTVNYRAVPTLTYYRDKYPDAAERTPESVEWGAGQISLPFFPKMTMKELEYVTASIRRIMSEINN